MPIDPPIAIICKCRFLSFFANGALAVFAAAAFALYVLPATALSSEPLESRWKPLRAFCDNSLTPLGRTTAGLAVTTVECVFMVQMPAFWASNESMDGGETVNIPSFHEEQGADAAIKREAGWTARGGSCSTARAPTGEATWDAAIKLGDTLQRRQLLFGEEPQRLTLYAACCDCSYRLRSTTHRHLPSITESTHSCRRHNLLSRCPSDSGLRTDLPMSEIGSSIRLRSLSNLWKAQTAGAGPRSGEF